MNFQQLMLSWGFENLEGKFLSMGFQELPVTSLMA
jgi:hypothetical protein